MNRTYVAVFCVMLQLSQILSAIESHEGLDDNIPSALEGKWRLHYSIIDGMRVDLDGRYWVIKGNKAAMLDGGKLIESATFTINSGKDPLTIDMTIVSKKGLTGTLLGIYKIEGDALTILLAYPGNRRPATFEERKEIWMTNAQRTKK